MKKVFGFTLVLALIVGYYLYDKNKSKVVEKTVVSQKWQTSMRKLLLMDYESLDCPKDSVQIKPKVTYLTTPFEKVGDAHSSVEI